MTAANANAAGIAGRGLADARSIARIARATNASTRSAKRRRIAVKIMREILWRYKRCFTDWRIVILSIVLAMLSIRDGWIAGIIPVVGLMVIFPPLSIVLDGVLHYYTKKPKVPHD